MRAAIALSAACGLAGALHVPEVAPLYDAVEYYTTRKKKRWENPCKDTYTPQACAVPGASAKTATAVFSTFHEDLRWLLYMPWEDNLTVYVHDRSMRRSHRSKGEVADSLNLAEEAEAEVKALSTLRKTPIKFVDIPNKGDEAAAYLAFIIQKYNKLPDVTFFLQGHQCAEHANFDMAEALPSIRQCFDPAKGYLDLNVYRRGSNTKCKTTEAIIEKPIFGFHVDKLENLWRDLFAEEFGPMPVTFCWDAFGQFAVTRERIRKHPVEFYRKLFKAVVAGNTTMEFFWRAIFVPTAMSWDPIVHHKKAEYVFTEEEKRERERWVDPRGQKEDRPQDWW